MTYDGPDLEMHSASVFDMKTGFILKLSENKLINSAWNGFEKVSFQELQETYGQ
jgi:hypothetical protein